MSGVDANEGAGHDSNHSARHLFFRTGSRRVFGQPRGSEPPEPEAPPPIDWRDFVDDMKEGDHVVGEELCAAPGGIEPVSNLPKYA